jgi:hypothetical protein
LAILPINHFQAWNLTCSIVSTTPTSLLLKTFSFLLFQTAHKKEHQIIAKHFLPLFPLPYSTREPNEEDNERGGIIT